MQAPRRVFDAHFHIGPYGTKAFAERHGLGGGVIVPTYLQDQRAAFRYNYLLLDGSERHEALFGGLWVSPLPDVEALNNEALAALPHPGIQALKIASNTWRPRSIAPSSWPAHVQRNVEQILEAAAAHRLVIHFPTGYLPGADPLEFDALPTPLSPPALSPPGSSMNSTASSLPPTRRGAASRPNTGRSKGWRSATR